MLQTIKKRLIDGVFSTGEMYALLKSFEGLFSTQNLVSPGLAIKTGGSSPQFQTGAISYVIGGTLYQKAAVAASNVPAALSWTGAAGVYNAGALLLTVDNAGNLYTYVSNIASSSTSMAVAIQGIQWPWVQDASSATGVAGGQAVIGAIIVATNVANTTFTGGTTNLDTAAITTTYINITGPFYPNEL